MFSSPLPPQGRLQPVWASGRVIRPPCPRYGPLLATATAVAGIAPLALPRTAAPPSLPLARLAQRLAPPCVPRAVRPVYHASGLLGMRPGCRYAFSSHARRDAIGGRSARSRRAEASRAAVPPSCRAARHAKLPACAARPYLRKGGCSPSGRLIARSGRHVALTAKSTQALSCTSDTRHPSRVSGPSAEVFRANLFGLGGWEKDSASQPSIVRCGLDG